MNAGQPTLVVDGNLSQGDAGVEAKAHVLK